MGSALARASCPLSASISSRSCRSKRQPRILAYGSHAPSRAAHSLISRVGGAASDCWRPAPTRSAASCSLEDAVAAASCSLTVAVLAVFCKEAARSDARSEARSRSWCLSARLPSSALAAFRDAAIHDGAGCAGEDAAVVGPTCDAVMESDGELRTAVAAVDAGDARTASFAVVFVGGSADGADGGPDSMPISSRCTRSRSGEYVILGV
mmetsp:Transcript_7086/g.15527  ORF Transcript_7086/g.15527 Transcript_7086/m.15527 type:complete len:209 (+) Transcript_7086:1083-1709(+)